METGASSDGPQLVPGITLSDYQREAKRTMKPQRALRDDLGDYQMGAVCEWGKLGNVVKKVCYHNHPLDEAHRQKIREELGDTAWYLAAIASRLDIALAATSPLTWHQFSENEFPMRYQRVHFLLMHGFKQFVALDDDLRYIIGLHDRLIRRELPYPRFDLETFEQSDITKDAYARTHDRLLDLYATLGTMADLYGCNLYALLVENLLKLRMRYQHGYRDDDSLHRTI